jgi:hypothetical protein
MQNNDPQNIWQSQKTEEIKVPLAYFKHKADQQRSRNLWVAVANDAVYLASVVFLGIVFVKTPNIGSKLGLVLLALGSLYAAYLRHKQLWPGSPASATPPDSGLTVYRRELLRWQHDQRHAWRMLAPLVPGAIVFAIIAVPVVVRAASANRAIFINAIPFCVMLAVWLLLLPVMRRRNLKKIQQELDALGS